MNLQNLQYGQYCPWTTLSSLSTTCIVSIPCNTRHFTLLWLLSSYLPCLEQTHEAAQGKLILKPTLEGMSGSLVFMYRYCIAAPVAGTCHEYLISTSKFLCSSLKLCRSSVTRFKQSIDSLRAVKLVAIITRAKRQEKLGKHWSSSLDRCRLWNPLTPSDQIGPSSKMPHQIFTD